jgi:TRAP-type C4-dicarboxylate transport system permease small subunit
VQKTISKIVTALGIASAIVMLGIMLICVYETGARFLFNAALGWAIEIPEFLLLVCSALALAYTQKVKRHISVKLIEDKLSERARKVLAIAVSPIYLALALGLLWGVTQWAVKFVTRSSVSFMVRIPLIIPQSFLVLGVAFLVIQVLIETIEIALSLKSTQE